jgi:acetylornithine/succinyldiaminopimelate/putrescine aminotransferase
MTPAYFVPNPLTMVSTWDGDELSMIRAHHNLMASRHIDRQPAVERLDTFAEQLTERGYPTRGMGLYRVVDLGQPSGPIVAALATKGVQVRGLPNQRIALIPPLDIQLDELNRIIGQISAILT